jgi:hypothetical protein
LPRPLATAAVVVALAASGGGYATTFAAFSSDSENTANSYAAGTVYLTDNRGAPADALPGLAGADPGEVSSGCVVVTYGGSLPARVRLYANSSGAITAYLTVKVTRGSGAGAFPSCAGFTPDSTDYAGLGPGVLYDGAVASFPTVGASGLLDPTAGSPSTWTTGSSHTYRFDVELSSDPAGQGQTGTLGFGFRANNT